MKNILIEASKLGLTQVVQQLLKEGKVDPKAHKSEALYMAICWGHIDCVKLLMPVSDPGEYSWMAYWAVRYGSIDIAKLFI